MRTTRKVNRTIVFDRHKRASEDRESAVHIRVTIAGRDLFLNTGAYCYPGEWNDAAKAVVGRRPDKVRLNYLIAETMERIEDYVRMTERENRSPSIAELKDWMSRSGDRESFLDYMTERIAARKDIRESTRKMHRCACGRLRDYGGIVTFGDLVPANIRRYDRWMHEQGLSKLTISTRHKVLKTYIHEAMVEGRLKENPYLGISISRGKSKERRYLTEEEVLAIRNLPISNESMTHVRDLFVFQVYTGFAFAELSGFEAGKAERLPDGRIAIRGRRQKTDEDYYTVLLSPAADVYRKYDGRLPLMSNQQYNMRLKILAQLAGLSRPVTSHMARHTFAVLALNAGVRIEVLAKMMGHTDIRTTQLYAKIVNKEVERSFASLEQALK